MICKHCGYDVPDGISFCTACGEPMPKQKLDKDNPTLTEDAAKEKEPLLAKKKFTKNYVPYTVKLSIHTGAFMSYVFTAIYLGLGVLSLLAAEVNAHTIVFIILFLIMGGLTLGFEIKKSFVCAVIFTMIAVASALYYLIVFHELMVIWICAGILGTYGTYHDHKLWQQYQKTGELPPRIN